MSTNDASRLISELFDKFEQGLIDEDELIEKIDEIKRQRETLLGTVARALAS
jgi:hypothetical protein